ncbi:adenylate/guanylate cyclase domain-containing protein [Ramlibacter solisilvae]|uniref:CHASE2 domain-containing protein n=1 Tax=Ramlibacter tataouinensis TaxID=94132 RepID=UPI000777598C|nr:adenylate/guanylate cyclase domain-containing protein [Ramlibacter tataouinensis]
MRNHRASFRWALIALLAALSMAMQWASPRIPVLSALDHLIGDRLHLMLASDEPEHRVVVVDLDESSIAALGPWPWPRARIADLLEALAGPYGARAVGLDIVFPSPADAAGDERLAALADFAPLVLAQALDFEQRDHNPQVASGKPVFGAPALQEAPAGIAATGYLANHDGLAKARCVGNIGHRLDPDGRVRRVPLMASWHGQGSPLLPVAMLACPMQRGAPVNAFDHLPRQLREDAEWALPFSRRWEAYTVIPARYVLDGSVPADLLRGRWVLVGSSALGLNDRAATPLAASAGGVMVHAAAMTSLLDHIEGKTAGLGGSGRWIAALWTLLTLAAGAWALGRYKAWWLIPATIAAFASWLAIAGWLVLQDTAFSPSAPLLAYVLMLFVISVELWMMQREQGQLLRSFASYVAPSVLNEMLRQGLENPMVPQHREITVISADMQDYTGLTNRSSLQEAAQLTREFLQCLTEPILRYEGTLDKYTGDGLVAFWGAPLVNPLHTHRALEAAQAMVANVRAWNEQRVAQGLAPARVRIGVEAGSVLVGDLGTRFRRTYTAVGDCINTASKLQAIAKTLSCDLVVGPVAARLAAGSALVPVTQVQLPGLREASVLWSFPSSSGSLPDAATRPGAVATAAG